MFKMINTIKKYLNKKKQAHFFIYLTSIDNTIKKYLYTIDGIIMIFLIFFIHHYNKIIKITSFEINDFGETSYSIMAKIIQIEENEINIKFIYRVNYRNKSLSNDDHYGVTEITFYKNKLIKTIKKNDNSDEKEKIAEGFYYSNEHNILRSGKIILYK